MKRKFRTLSAIVTALTALAIAGLSVPAASAADLELRFVGGQPQDAEVDATIRTADLNTGSSFVQIEVVDVATGARVTNFSKPIGFALRTGAGFASGDLDVTPQVPVNGVATFGEGTLSIGTENEPQFTDYSLIPVTTKGQSITGPASNGFNVWEDGESCNGSSDPCEAKLVPGSGSDTYTLANVAGSLGASELFGVLPGLTCPGQKLIFDAQVFSYATTETDGDPDTPVKLVNHITKRDWKASANNGQAHADWCIGLVHEEDWAASGATPTQLDTDGDGELDLWVAIAPKCPSQNPSASAPCIEKQNSDGAGGSIAIGWLPGGDPPRRT